MTNRPNRGENDFWRQKSLQEMSQAEWESLCDGCGRCCLVKLEDEDSGEIHNTSLSCQLLNTATCRCRDYANRHSRVDDCIQLNPENVSVLKWLPRSCAYRTIHEGRELEWWHPLVSGSAQTVIDAGISVAGRVTSKEGVEDEDAVDYMHNWPDW